MAAFFEAVFAGLFKYRPLVFEKGDFTFASSWPAWQVLAAVLLVAAPAIWTYTRARGRTRPGDRLLLSGLRLGIFALVLFCLLEPALLVERVVPQQSYVAVLLDDSRSMRVADEPGSPRTAFVASALKADGALSRALGQRFKLRYFRFASDLAPIAGPGDLAYAGTATRLGAALDQVRQEMAGVELAGVVVVSDGADNASSPLGSSLLPLKAAGVPVYAVGVGRERPARDVQISRVSAPARALAGGALVVDVVLVQHGFGGRKVQLDVEDGGRVVARREIELPGDGEATTARVDFGIEEPGARRFRFRIAPQPGETITENNEQEAIIAVERRREKILYFEGEPRFELKFVRRAAAGDPNLQVVALQRTAENKYLRLDVDSAGELATGFPTTRDELFAYRGLILGSVEASHFTHDQLQMIADFVGKRGGGLLVLGGRNALSEGGWAGTPLDEVLPVVLREQDDARETVLELKVKPTRAGLTSAALRLAASEEEAEALWERLPPLTAVNAATEARPGATTLLTGSPPAGGPEQIVLAFQRYGRGTAFALPVQDTWLWQMHADVPLEDQTHETFWRQLLRWLVAETPAQVTVAAAASHVEPGERVLLTAEVADRGFLGVNDAQVVATVVGPDGEPRAVPLEWSGERDGEYRGSVALPGRGLHEIAIEARRGDTPLGRATTHVAAAASNAEFFDAHLNAPALKRVAAETGGRYYTPATVETLADDISYTGRGDTVTERLDLWDMPLVFFLMVLLAAGEWVYRKAKALA